MILLLWEKGANVPYAIRNDMAFLTIFLENTIIESSAMPTKSLQFEQ